MRKLQKPSINTSQTHFHQSDVGVAVVEEIGMEAAARMPPMDCSKFKPGKLGIRQTRMMRLSSESF